MIFKSKKFRHIALIFSIIFGVSASGNNAIAFGGLNEIVLKTIIGGLLHDNKDCVNYIESGRKYYNQIQAKNDENSRNESQRLAYSMVSCGKVSHNLGLVHEFLPRAIENEYLKNHAYSLASMAEGYEGNSDAAFYDFMQISDDDVNILSLYPQNYWELFVIMAYKNNGSDNLYLKTLRRLNSTDYVNLNPSDAQDYKEAYILELAKVERNYQEVGKLIKDLRNPSFILDINIDKRYAELRKLPEFKAINNLPKATKNYIAWLRKNAPKNPKSLYNSYIIGINYIKIGKLDEAISYIKPIADNMVKNKNDYYDYGSHAVWNYDLLGHLYYLKNDYANSVKYYNLAINIDGPDGANWSQRINLANALIIMGHHDEAIAALSVENKIDLSSYGNSQRIVMLSCARHFAQKDLNKIPIALDELKALGRDGINAQVQLGACLGDTDMIATNIIKMLNEDYHRSTTIKNIVVEQNYTQPLNSIDAELHDNLLKAINRSDVQEVFNKYADMIKIPPEFVGSRFFD